MQRVISHPVMGSMIAVSIFSATAGAAEVYKWVTPDGVTHFSEAPPETAVASVEVVDVDAAQAVATEPRDYQSVLDVAKSIEASRLQRERLRLEKRRLQLERRPPPAPPAVDYGAPVARIYYPPYHRSPPGYRPFYGKPRFAPVPWSRHGPGRRPSPTVNRPNSLAHIKP